MEGGNDAVESEMGVGGDEGATVGHAAVVIYHGHPRSDSTGEAAHGAYRRDLTLVRSRTRRGVPNLTNLASRVKTAVE